MALLKPFLPVKVRQEGCRFETEVLNRTIGFGENSLPESIRVKGREILNGPVILTGEEDGEKIVWDNNYPDNESEMFVQKRTDEKVILCGAMRSLRFIVDTCIEIGYDGSVQFDLKLMPAGKTVAQVFGLAADREIRYQMDRLVLEIPLKKDIATHYSIFPNSTVKLSDGTVLPENAMSNSGGVSDLDMYFPFKALFWTGSDESGLGIYADNEKNREIADPEKAIELIHRENEILIRVHLLDRHPSVWKEDPVNGCDTYRPISFRFGLMPTPVKEFPKNPYFHNGLHIDCFTKIKGNYIDFLTAENRFDRMKEKGVTTLILHEKWNKSQNWFELSEYTAGQLEKIVYECHKRGIRVLTYFGYEISSMAPIYSDECEETRDDNYGKMTGGWYRVPYQRDYRVCYGGQYREQFLKGIADIMDRFHTDGIYLDGTAYPAFCTNVHHGCGWYDSEGKLHGSYPVAAVQGMFRELYEIVHQRGGIINVHSFGCLNFTALPYIDISWYGENLQFDYIQGRFSDAPLEYFQAEYTGRNMGVPVEMIAYEKRPIWNFENALALSTIHGILPRPNDIDGPLELMAGVWKILDAFPLTKSEWKPYWTNGAETSDDKVKCSYYKYVSPVGKTMLLVFVSNTSCRDSEKVTVQLKGEKAGEWYDLTDGSVTAAEPVFSLAAYTGKILMVEEGERRC